MTVRVKAVLITGMLAAVVALARMTVRDGDWWWSLSAWVLLTLTTALKITQEEREE